jgi:hypothetical protein
MVGRRRCAWSSIRYKQDAGRHKTGFLTRTPGAKNPQQLQPWRSLLQERTRDNFGISSAQQTVSRDRTATASLPRRGAHAARTRTHTAPA